MAKKEAIQDYLIELKAIDRHIKELQQQVESLEEQGMELAYIRQSIDELAQAPAGEALLVPLSNGIFAKARLEDKDHLLVNVGANVVVKKTFSETKAMMEGQSAELQKMRKTLESSIHKLVARAMEIDQMMSAMGD